VREEKEKKRKGKGSVAALRDLASGLSRACARARFRLGRPGRTFFFFHSFLFSDLYFTFSSFSLGIQF
jgi:hypothetical protein